jgi:hypothetical protein
MNLTKLKLVICAFFVISTNAQAQDEQSGRNSVVKFSPSKLMRGQILFSYERKIAEQASLEVSFGPAISNVSPFNLDHLFDNGSNATENSLLGFAVSAAARYYPLEDKDALEGFYISPIFGFNQLNYLYSEPNVFGSGNGLEDVRGNSKRSSFAFVFGTQKWLSNSFSIDMYIGSGLRNLNSKTYFIDYITDPVTFNTTTKWVEQNSSDVQWFITGGVKVGIGFGKKK